MIHEDFSVLYKTASMLGCYDTEECKICSVYELIKENKELKKEADERELEKDLTELTAEDNDDVPPGFKKWI